MKSVIIGATLAVALGFLGFSSELLAIDIFNPPPGGTLETSSDLTSGQAASPEPGVS